MPLPGPLLLGHSVGYGLSGGDALSDLIDQGLGGLGIARFHERFHLVFASYVVGRPHLFFAAFIGDEAERFGLLVKWSPKVGQGRGPPHGELSSQERSR